MTTATLFRFRMPRPSALAAAVLAVLIPAASSAQETSGKTALLSAVDAAKQLSALKADVELSGAGGFADWVPSGRGTIALAKAANAESDKPLWATRVDTTYVHKKGDVQKNVVILRTPDGLTWIDHESESVQERSLSDRRSPFRSIPELFGLPELTDAEPYRRELREATSWESLGTETVNGEACDVVLIKYDMTKSKSPAGGSMIRTPSSKWFFSTEDRLPRRVERITNTAGMSFTIVQDLRDVQINPELSPADLAIETPEGYSRTIRNQPGGRRSLTAGPVSEMSAEQEKAEAEKTARRNQALPAHGFELIDGDGNEVSLDSLKDNVAVLYFWGTWCVPCKDFSPLVSDLVGTFEGQPVRVFGLPVRERSAEAVREAMAEYDHTLLLNPGGEPIGCDATARAYKVRRYPTIYVIGFDSEVLSFTWPESGKTPEETMAEIEQTIREYLADQG